MLAPAHLRNVDQALNTRLNLYESTVVSHNNYLTLNVVANLEVRIQRIPRVLSKLLETESDTLLLLIEVEDNNVNLLVESNNLMWIAYAAPREVSDMYESVNTTEVNEYTVRCDVFNSTLEDLTLLKVRDNLLTLCLELSLDECLV